MSFSQEESIYDDLGYESMLIGVNFLLPTGIFIYMDVMKNSSIRKVKSDLWQEAMHYPLFSKLKNETSYSFLYITSFGTHEEIVDESKRLHEFDLFHKLPVLKVIQSQGDVEEKQIIQEIQHLAETKSVDEQNLQLDAECKIFRQKMRRLALEASQERDKSHWKVILKHHYPPTIIPYLNKETHLKHSCDTIGLEYGGVETTFFIDNPDALPDELTAEAVRHLHSSSTCKLPSANPDDYVLKKSGNEFIVGDHKLFTFKCLREALVSDRDAISDKSLLVLTLLHVGEVKKLLPETSHILQQMQKNLPPPRPEKIQQTSSLWNINSKFTLRVVKAGNVNCGQEKDKKLIVHIGLYHGLETLCATTYTKEHSKEGTGGECIWDEECSFDFNICNLPRNAKLCIVICEVKKNKRQTFEKNRKQVFDSQTFLANSTPIAWVNMMVFDYNQQLKTGLQRLDCWLWPDNLDPNQTLDSNNLKSNGIISTNPYKEDAPFFELLLPECLDSNQQCLELKVDAENKPESKVAVRYPSHSEIMHEAAKQSRNSVYEVLLRPSEQQIEQLSEICNKSRFDDLFENERILLWFLRFECRDRFPEALPKVLSTIRWNSYKDVALAHAMLEAWRPLSPERAMELLDSRSADEKVREFAVKSLEELRDDELQQYLLQLVQVLKFDSYLDSSLVRFILKRAWNNRKIGHFLFWHLKAEITDTTPNIRISLILEAYLYGNISHMKVLHKQYEALNKMRTLNKLFKTSKFGQKDIKTAAREQLTKLLSQSSFADSLSQVEHLLEPNICLEQITAQKCKVMNSKMRPLWLEFSNHDIPDGKISVIYKNGDDLRQDMLTLQIISIMDMLWKSEGLDLRMIPYGCLATGKQSGMIEAVTSSNTIANIQKTVGGAMNAFNKRTLLDWIDGKNPKTLDNAIENFTYSCAGYCVATFVLGVGDRHSDNIMITEKGQLFHIDFGHILGNFKSKYGIKRERVPFVLAHDFVHVINKGKEGEKEKFEVFRSLCDRAFCILRKKADLFITLFALMVHSGLPELTSMADLEYIRYALGLDVSEKKALERFRTSFNLAVKNSWSTSINWFIHNKAKN